MSLEIIKFIHIVFALLLFGMVFFNLAYTIRSTSANTLLATEYIGIAAAMIMLVTGGMLVIPKGYLFTTPWINAAFVFLTVVICQIGLSIYLKSHDNQKLNKFLTLNYIVMIIIIVGIIHDAVTKHTLWQ